MDWNGDGRVNSMDTYDMMHDTSGGGNYCGGGGMTPMGVAILKALALPALALFVGLFNEPLGIVIALIWGVKVICFSG